jgi:FtsH-binding integral membrane protein
MFIGLLVTFGVSLAVLNTPAFGFLLNPKLTLTLCIVELGLVAWLCLRVMKMSPSRATSVFLAYSALNGITLAPLFFIYTSESVASAFLVSSSMFGAMALYGYTTKKDLSSWGSFLFMGLIGVIIASVVSFFWSSSAFIFAINIASVVVFTGLTAYDVNRIKAMGAEYSHMNSGQRNVAIIGALSLYLNFINLFITILRLFGSRD